MYNISIYSSSKKGLPKQGAQTLHILICPEPFLYYIALNISYDTVFASFFFSISSFVFLHFYVLTISDCFTPLNSTIFFDLFLFLPLSVPQHLIQICRQSIENKVKIRSRPCNLSFQGKKRASRFLEKPHKI